MKKLNKTAVHLGVTAILTAGLISGPALATLPKNAVLKAVNGTMGGQVPPPDGNGSYFFMGGIAVTPIAIREGLTLGYTQAGTGAMACGPDSIATMTLSIDEGWCFFSNSGTHWTSIAPTVMTDDGAGTVTLDLSGWTVSWSGSVVPMPGNGFTPDPNDSIADVACENTCEEGELFTMDQDIIVPAVFPGVPYSIHLEGTIEVPFDVVNPVDQFSTDGDGVVTAGVTATAVGKTTGSGLDNVDTGVDDPDVLDGDAALNQCIGGCVDFEIAGIAGTSAEITFAVSTPIPVDAVYRKLDVSTSTWSDFDDTTGDSISSAMDDGSGNCQSPATSSYTPGLTAGDTCIKLSIEDGGPNDADGVADGTVMDPGGVALTAAPAGGSSSGCSLTTDTSSANTYTGWAMLGAFLVWLGTLVNRRKEVN